MSKQTKGFIFLWLGMIFFASSNPVIAKLGELGSVHLVNGKNPISFCNVLFAGNVAASLVVILMNYKKLTLQYIRPLKMIDWLNMLAVAIFAAVLAPSFYFYSLLLTSVINVVLISTLSIPLTLLYGLIFFKDRPSFLVYVGAFFALVGIAVTYILTPAQSTVSKGLVFMNLGTGSLAQFIAAIPQPGKLSALLATVLLVISNAISRKTLESIPIGIYLVFRMCFGSIIFGTLVWVLFGPSHFATLLSPFLWQWMLVYGGLVVALGTLLWYLGVRVTTSAEVSIVNSFIPVAGVILAYLIVREVPNKAQVIGGIIIILGVFISLIGKLRKKHILEAETKFKKPGGFIGV